MGKSRGKNVKLDKWVGTVALATSVVALFLSWQANRIAREANELTQESISVARESNRIGLLDKTDPQTIRGSGTIPVDTYGCKYPSSTSYYVYSVADVHITFSNNGGRTASLERVELKGTPYTWSVKAYDEQGGEVLLPATIYPATSIRWHFIAKSKDYSDTESGATQIHGERYPASPILQWIFYFEDGRVVTWETQSYGSAPKLDFSRNCEELDNSVW